MLFQTDKQELGDKRLDPKENVAKLRELCLKDASKYRIEDQDELTNAKRSEGTRLNYTELVERLGRIVPDLSFKEGAPGQLAMYCPRNASQLEAAIREGSGGSGTDLFFLLNRYVGGLPKDELPEWGYLGIDTSLLPTRETLRGWRTILIGLIRAGVLSYDAACAEFGDPSTDPRNVQWMKKTLEWRENGSKKFTMRDIMEARH